MDTSIKAKPLPGGSMQIIAEYHDMDAAETAFTPLTVIWSLTDTSGNIINSRHEESLTPSTSNSIILFGDDLPSTVTEIVFHISGTYDSSTYGAGQIFKAQARIQIDTDYTTIVEP